MALVSRWLTRTDLSQRSFDDEVRSLEQRVALEDLGHRLKETGPIPVLRTIYTPLGGRVRLDCADGSALKLRLFWPRRDPVDTLDSIRFDDRVGWIVGTQSGGSLLVFYAWLATYQSMRKDQLE
jgi:hypothetical protein